MRKFHEVADISLFLFIFQIQRTYLFHHEPVALHCSTVSFLGSKKGVRTHYLPGICTFSIHHSKFSTLHRWTKSSDQFTLASVIVQTKASVKLVSYAPSNASMKWSLLSGHNFPIFCFSHTVLCHPRLGILSLNSGDSRCMRHQGFLFPLLCRVTAEEDFED